MTLNLPRDNKSSCEREVTLAPGQSLPRGSSLSRVHVNRPLDIITNRKIRVQYTKFRLGNHNLEIEKGHHMKVERDNRYCKLCATGDIGDELHLSFDCNKLYKSRPSFLDHMYKRFSHTKQLDDTGKCVFLSNEIKR